MSAIVDGFRNFVLMFKSFGNSVVSVLDYVLSIIKTLWFGLTSMLTGLWDLIVDLFNLGVFELLPPGFNNLAIFIGTPAVIFISSLLLFTIFRIGISFVFKLFRLRMDYNTMKTKRK